MQEHFHVILLQTPDSPANIGSAPCSIRHYNGRWAPSEML